MRIIDETYTTYPFYGSRRMLATLQQKGFTVNRKRVIRLMNKMGLRALFPRRNLSKSVTQHKKYPYLLGEVSVERRDQVWSTDITYVPMRGGYLYLTAIMDWHTRYVLSWRLSNTLDVGFCLEALEDALDRGQPEIFNSDQGSQYTSNEFTDALEKRGIRISMDGKGRAFDNILVERLWRTVKYEEIYLKGYENGREAQDGLRVYMKFYNERRPHQALGYQSPSTAYFGKKVVHNVHKFTGANAPANLRTQ